MSPKLEAKALCYQLPDKTILNDVSFSLTQGEVLAIAGPSGSGKSCLLRLLNRLNEPTAGTVYLDGHDYRQLSPQQLRQRVGYIPQTPALQPGTVLENVTIGPRLRGETVAEEFAQHLLTRLHLTGYDNHEVSRLSGGEQQRVAIARTLLNQPEILLLDEPSSSLDHDTQQELERFLQELIHSYEVTCVLVTHDEMQAKRLAQRMVRLEKGAMVAMEELKPVVP